MNEKELYLKIRKIIDDHINNESDILFSDVYDLLFNNEDGYIMNLNDIDNKKKIIKLLYDNTPLNLNNLFYKIYPEYFSKSLDIKDEED